MSNPNSTEEMKFDQGIAISEIPDGTMLSGTFQDNQVLLVHKGGEFFAVGAHCTHYGGELVKGLLVDNTVRCPLHHMADADR